MVKHAVPAYISRVGRVRRRQSFVFATFFASSFISWRLGAKLISAFTAGLIISVTIFILFRKVLGLSLATGPFGF